MAGEPAAKRSRVHFGSLEEQEKKRLEQGRVETSICLYIYYRIIEPLRCTAIKFVF